MKILVTGGMGYIGSHLVRMIIRHTSHDVVVLDHLKGSPAQVKTLEAIGCGSTCTDIHAGERQGADGRRAVLEVGDVRDEQFLDAVFTAHAPVVAVMHLSSLIEVGESVVDPLLYYDNNIVSVIRLLQAMRRHRCDKFIFSSSAAIFSNDDTLAEQSDNKYDALFRPLGVDAAKGPGSPYGSTKLMAETILRDSAKAYGIKCVALRYFNAAGAHPDGDIGECHEPETHLIPNVLRVPLAETINRHYELHNLSRPRVRNHIQIFGTDFPTRDGTCVRDYVHVNDLAEAHLLALDYVDSLTECQKDPYFKVFNLGTENGYTVREVVECARRVTGHPIPLQEVSRRPGDVGFLVACSKEAERVLGWKPKYTSLDQIMETAWRFHQAHPFGCDNVVQHSFDRE